MTSTLTPPVAGTAVRPRKVSMPYLPGLDGLRAISVVAVLLYHARDLDIAWLPQGGFLGVEVFFVISGYLITALLAAEFRNSAISSGKGHINFGRFWIRRARRLLPALFLLLGVVSLYWTLFIRNELYQLRGDVVAALSYVTNWYLIFSNQSYFAHAGRPSPFQHLWSLAVEEQFYLIWPLVFFGLLVICKGHKGRLVGIILTGVALSTVLMAVMYDPDVDPSRVYYGTDTRAAGLLLGAALAVLLPPWRLKPNVGRYARWVIDGVGVLALGGLFWFFRNTNEFDPFLYQGGFVLLSLTAAILIAVAAHPASLLGQKVLGYSVFLWIGRRSYGIYLWHWPIFMITRPDLDVPLHGYLLLAIRLALTFVVAELSYRFVEMPVRRGVIGNYLRRYREARGEAKVSLVRKSTLAGAVGAVLALVICTGYATARPNTQTDGITLGGSVASAPTASLGTTTPTHAAVAGSTATTPATTGAKTPAGVATTAKGPAAGTTAAPTSAAQAGPYAGVVAIGDSVMLGAKAALEQRMPGITVDAMVNRQVKAGAQIAATMLAAGQIGRAVIIHLGTNGITSQDQFDQLMATLKSVPKVVMLNTKVPRPWESRVNGFIAATAQKYPNIVFIDWKAQSTAHPDWFYGDGIHLRPKGAAAFADLIAQAVG